MTMEPQKAQLWAAATRLLDRGVPVAMVQISWAAGKKTITQGFTPPSGWQSAVLATYAQVTAAIDRGCNAYLYRLPDDVWVVDADTPEAVAEGLAEFGTPPAVRTRKGAHWLVRSDGPLSLDGTVYDSHQPRQLYGPGSFYAASDGAVLYTGAVPDFATVPLPPERLRALRPSPARVAAGPAVEPSGFFAPAPVTREQAKAQIEEKLREIAEGPSQPGTGGRSRVMGAALLMGGYLHAGWFTADEAADALAAACARCWGGEADDDDHRWIADGLKDGDKPAKRIATQRSAEEKAAAGEPMDDSPDPFAFTDDDFDGSVELPQAVYGAFGGPRALFYPDKVHWLQGESDSGKSWVGLSVVADVVERGGTAWVLDYENSRAEFAGRLKALGVTKEQMRSVSYVPGDVLTFAELRGYIASHGVKADMMLLDGVTSALSAMGKSGRDEQEFGQWFDAVPAQAKMAVCVDHVVKAIDDRRGMAVGTQAKKGRPDVAYEVVCSAPFGRGRSGAVELVMQKDRHGGIGMARGERVRLAVTSSAGGLAVKLSAPSSVEDFLTDANEATFSALYANGISASCSVEELSKAIRGAGGTVRNSDRSRLRDLYARYWADRQNAESAELPVDNPVDNSVP